MSVVSLIGSDADEVVQTDLTSQSTLHLMEPLNLAGVIDTDGESDEPLFRLTITRFTDSNSTSIGMCMSHLLCAFSLGLSSSSRCVGGNDSGRWIRFPAVSRATLSAIPGSQTGRSPLLIRTRSDQVLGTIGGSITGLIPKGKRWNSLDPG